MSGGMCCMRATLADRPIAPAKPRLHSAGRNARRALKLRILTINRNVNPTRAEFDVVPHCRIDRGRNIQPLITMSRGVKIRLSGSSGCVFGLSRGSRIARPTFVTAATLALWVFAAGGCARSSALLGPSDWDTLISFPGERVTTAAASPDGTLFVATVAGIYRLVPTSEEWSQVVQHQEFLTRLYAPSRETLLALTRFDRVYRWNAADGWRELPTPRLDWLIAGTGLPRLILLGIWGRSEDDVYVVGDRGVILHFDGAGWSLEPNPLLSKVDSPGVDPYQLRLWAVTGDSQQIYAAGNRILRRVEGAWKDIEGPISSLEGGLLTAAADQSGITLFGGGHFIQAQGVDIPLLYSLEDSRWQVLSQRVRGFRGAIRSGATQPDGSALFWTSKADVVELTDDHRLHVYQLAGFRELRAAATLGPYLYLAGSVGDTGVVVRIRRVSP